MTYNVDFKLRLTSVEKEKLRRDAKNAGLSLSAYMRELINGNEPKSRVDLLELMQLRVTISDMKNEINKIGVNINQVTRSFNATYFSENEKRKLYGYLMEFEKINSKLEKLCEEKR